MNGGTTTRERARERDTRETDAFFSVLWPKLAGPAKTCVNAVQIQGAEYDPAKTPVENQMACQKLAADAG